MTLGKSSPCKVNLLLNILGRRADGFHELETLFHPVGLCDELCFTRGGAGVQLTCSNPNLATDATNLVHRASTAFRAAADTRDGVRIHLEKNIPMAAGLGGGSGNAATTLLGLNDLFDRPLSDAKIDSLAATLGSDVNFFLQNKPALAAGRGEKVKSLDPSRALRGAAFLLIHPGFGISTAWAYQNLARFPAALNGTPGRAAKLVSVLEGEDLAAVSQNFYNSLEAPALHKYPALALFQEFLRENGAAVALMSGSGSTTFATTRGVDAAETLREQFLEKFGRSNWTAIVPC